jgi:Mal s 1 allergenic protein-like
MKLKSRLLIAFLSLIGAANGSTRPHGDGSQESATRPPAAATTSATSASLSGNGLAQHPFLYCGEWDTRKSVQTIYLVKDGKVVWTYTVPNKDELDDCTMLSNGNILFARRGGATEVTPQKKVVWNYDAPPGTEIHTAQPIGKYQVLLMQNGNPARLLIVNKLTGRVEMEHFVTTGNPEHTHPQFRHVRLTNSGTFLLPHLDMGKVIEYNANWEEIWSVDAPSAWAAVRLKNGNTLISGNEQSYVREVNPKGETVWEINRNDLPGITLHTVQEVNRLANGNTVICNWFGSAKQPEWPSIVQVIEVTPEKRVVWTLRDWENLGPASTIQLLDEPGVAENGDLQR